MLFLLFLLRGLFSGLRFFKDFQLYENPIQNKKIEIFLSINKTTTLPKQSVNNQQSMSISMKSTNAKKTLCQVCKDAGKTEKEYTSHFVRDKPGPDGVTVCPLLLSLNCRKCGKKGHTFKYCKVNMEKKKEPTPRLAEKPNDTPKQKQGKFDSLVESSDEEEGEEKEQEPIKQNAVEVEASPKVMSYADKLKAKLLPLAPTLPDMAVLRSAPTLLVQAPTLPDMVVLPQAPTLLAQAPTLPQALPQAPALQAPTLPRAPILPVTEEEKEKIQKLKDGCKKIISQRCSWAESDSESDDEDD